MIATKDIVAEAKAIESQIVSWRRYLHQYPELSFQEYETAKYIEERLSEIEGISIQTNIGKTGIIATISNGEGKTVAVRADMDALPITEKNDHGFQSKNPGVMHACGHDAHTAILLGVANILAKKAREGLFQGTIKLIFQPAEEAPDEEGLSGAPRMMQEGALENVESIVALHMCPWEPVGTIQMNNGYSMANVDVFHGKIKATGGHGGYPHLGTDPIWMLSFFLQAFYGMISRKISALDTAVASIGQIETGTASNIIPEEISITGTLRTYTPEVREQLAKEVEQAFKVVESLGGSYSFEVQRGEPALNNNPKVNEIIKNTAMELYPSLKIVEKPFGLGGEDFGYMTREIPGAMFFLGCALPDGISRDLHTNIFDIDERCLPIGVSILAASALQLLRQP
ncbi:amidohydrolase [Ureibacillus sp. FSL K6-0786]|uniref:M20 metallopeptidase family protein n=1 Tax=Ureibacillus sp. FSL K6-0786 TaxID=2954607 RepID=UPI0030D6DDCA